MKYWLGKDNETKINGKIPSELFSIPLAYIKTIEMKDIEKKISIYFGNDSCEVITINKEDKRLEIFESLKTLSPKFMYSHKKVGKFGAAKKPLLALLILSIIFGISYYMAVLIENDELYGDQIIILLAIASLGTKNIIKIFGLIVTILSIAIYRKMSNTYVLHSINRKN